MTAYLPLLAVVTCHVYHLQLTLAHPFFSQLLVERVVDSTSFALLVFLPVHFARRLLVRLLKRAKAPRRNEERIAYSVAFVSLPLLACTILASNAFYDSFADACIKAGPARGLYMALIPAWVTLFVLSIQYIVMVDIDERMLQLGSAVLVATPATGVDAIDVQATLKGYAVMALVISMVVLFEQGRQAVGSQTSARKLPATRWVQLQLVTVGFMLLLNQSATATSDTPDHHLLYSQKSATGWIVVGEQAAHDTSFRYLRADHSLLGGLWVQPARKQLAHDKGVPPSAISDEDAVEEADTIFENFLLLEIGRLARPLPLHPETERVLTIGLGAGMATRAAHEFGFNVTAVELDPAVIDAAQRYFGCPQLLGDYVAEDARHYLSATPADLLFEHIIHDVYTGGAIVPDLVSTDFIELMKKHLSPTGIVVLNFVAWPRQQSWQLVGAALKHSFKHVRAFHERRTVVDEQPDDAPRNMVFVASDSPIVFRPAHQLDLIPRPAGPRRRALLASFEKLEVDLSSVDPAPLCHREKVKLKDEARDGAVAMWEATNALLPTSTWARYRLHAPEHFRKHFT